MFPFAGTQHFNNLSSIFNISDTAVSLAAVTPKHISAIEVDTLWEANIQCKYTLREMLKYNLYS